MEYIEKQPTNNHEQFNISDSQFKNEKLCNTKNRKFIGCLNKYNGNFFYCDKYYMEYLQCMGFINY